VPVNFEGQTGENAAHQDDEDPEDNLTVGVDLVNESVVQDEP
jgi:hypothetical protein